MTKAQKRAAHIAMKRGIKKIGGPAAVSRLYTPPIKPQAVSQWKVVPAKRAYAFAKSSGEPLSILCPDVFMSEQERPAA